MAVYEFKCPKCGNTGSINLPMSKSRARILCEPCTDRTDCPHYMRRVYTPPHIIVRGGTRGEV